MSDWRVWDHGDPEVDDFWRRILNAEARVWDRLLGPSPIARHASLGGAIPHEDARYVPPELQGEGRYDFESLRICEAIWKAS